MGQQLEITLPEEAKKDSEFELKVTYKSTAESKVFNWVDKDKTKQLTADGTAWEENFINFLTNKIDKIEGSENVSISINGDKPKPIKEIKKKIN